MAYLFLALTIIAEVTGAITSRYSEGFKKLLPSLATIIVIIASYFFFAISLQYGLNIGIGYAIWAGIGVVVIAIFGLLFFKEYLTKVQVYGIALIIVGVIALELGAI
ncbi:DMT family transporter [Bacillus horti]|uniref:Small multidrug resistance pump n=1 Tax=Caldalkalibacillus horti TaxID=77523 RepID=A0ABT9VUG6_9BACI|nr:multidrug efflux SMR transporter [Bacillus horti]MDQ0164631.1 small multidrug resistance pump [Bacillus horti]